MAKLGYGLMTLTDLTETIPISLVLETSQHIQTKTGNLYEPNFEDGEELIITPSLFQGSKEIPIPLGVGDGKLYYQTGEMDANGEIKYYYDGYNHQTASEKRAVWVDNAGALHYQKNLTQNLTIEAYIDNYKNGDHGFTIELIQASNPIQILFLEDNSGKYTAIITSADGREHFEDGNFKDITLTASLYYGKDAFSEGITYQWYKLSKPNEPFPSEEKSTLSTITVSRSDVISEERFKCIITHEETGIKYDTTFDIWDKTDEYDCIILSSDPLLLSEDDKTITLSVNVFNKNGELINGEDSSVDLSYEWRIGESEEVLTTKSIELSSNGDNVPKKQSFPVFCKVFLGQGEESRRLITQEIETIQFVPAFTARVTPSEIFIPVDSDGNHLGSNWNYTFTFSLLDKAGNVMPFITDDTDVERGPINGNNVTFKQQSSLWEFNGTVNVENNWSQGWIENTKFLEFTYVYCGKTFTFGIMLIKNVKGDSNYNAFITSSSGSTLMNGDNETQLEAFLYYGKQILTDNLFYEWIASGVTKNLGSKSTTTIMASDFNEKTNITCNIYLGTEENHQEQPLASPSYTLINLTQALPVSLILESDYAQHIQTKLGNFYEPNFSESTPLKIKPTLKVGQTAVDFTTLNGENSSYGGTLKYEIESSAFELPISIEKGNKNDKGFEVDNAGILSCTKNFPANVTFEAYITNFTIQGVNYGTIQAMNPINFLLLEQGKDTAIATITSTREYFDDKNATDITLTASLAGSNSTDLSYLWTKALNPNSTIANNKAQAITIQRSNIINQEIYSCEITNKTTGLTYSTSKIIYDFTDEYFCEISYDKPLLLTEKNTQVNLSVNVWDKYGNEIDTKTTQLSYIWDTIPDKNSGDPIGTGQTFTLNTSNASIPQKQTFTVYCRVYLTDDSNNSRQIASDSVTFQYTSEYQVKVTPSTIFIPTTSNGEYNDNGSNSGPKTYSFNFKLLDTGGNPITFTSTSGNETRPSGQTNSDGTTITFGNSINGKWDFNATITFSQGNTDYLWSEKNKSVGARTYEFTYVYMGQTFTEEINIIKSYAGKEGQSFSGYTVDLSNSFHAFKGGEISADPNQNPVECIVTAYYGDEPCDIEEIRLGSTTGNIIYSSSNSSQTEIDRDNLFILATKTVVGQEGAVKLTFTPGKSGQLLTEVKPVNLYVKILPPEGERRTIVKTFSYVINYGGRSYYLDFNGNNTIAYNKSGTYTPSSLTVQALYRDTTNAPMTYSNGIIIYRKNNSSNWTLISKTGSGTISNYSNFQNLQVRLYKSTAFNGKAVNGTITSNEIESNADYLLDSEVIPVLTSMEGYEIGGDNLIKWSKTFSSLDSSRWTLNSNVSIQSSLDFFEAVWNGTGPIYSPLIEYSSAYSNKDFCLSFDIDRSGTLTIYIVNSSTNISYQAATNLIVDSGSGYTRAYAIFKLPSGINSNFKVQFSGTSGLKIKKPKLEIGNIPSSWSASPYDIDYEDIVGANLIAGGYLKRITTTAEELYDELLPNTTYTLSWGSVEPASTTLSFSLNGSNYSQKTSPYTFNSGSSSTLFWSASQDATVKQIKLEKGSKVTDFIFTEDQLTSFFSNSSQGLQSIIGTQGELITDMSDLVDGLGKQISEQSGTLTLLNTKVTDSFELLEQKINLNGEYDGDQAIILTAQSFSSGKFELVLTNNRLAFLEGNKEIAYMSNQELFITHARITESLRIGNIKFIPTTTGTALIVAK